jgi:hypothetical protein
MTNGITRSVRLIVCLTAIGAAVTVHLDGLQSEPADGGVRAAMLRWRIGIDRSDPPSDMLEAITPLTLDGRRAWRVTHYPYDPNTAGFDLYDVDAATFSPIRSVMKSAALELLVSFGPAQVRLDRREKGTATSERIAIDGAVKPEGPGHRVFVASLPLKAGFTLKYRIVDRWNGKEQSRVTAMSLSVSERRRVETVLGAQEVFEVTTAAADGSFRIVEHVRTAPPHYPFRLEYTRGKTVLVSDVTTMAIESSRPDWERLGSGRALWK